MLLLQISWTHALRQIVINCYKFHGREDLLPAFTEDDEKVNQTSGGSSNNASVSSTVGVLKMHTSGNGTTTHKIQIQASGSPQIIAASPTALSGQTSQVCLTDNTGYNSDVDVRTTHITNNLCRTITLLYFFTFFHYFFYFYLHVYSSPLFKCLIQYRITMFVICMHFHSSISPPLHSTPSHSTNLKSKN